MRRMIAIGLVFAALALSMGVASAGTLRHPVVLKVQGQPTLGKVVQVRMQGDVPFIFDTGAGVTLVTPSVAKRLGCHPFGQVAGFRATGELVKMPHCGETTLHIGDFAATSDVAVFKLMALIERQSGTAAKHTRPMQVGGLISLASFSGQAITLDFAHDRVIVETPESLRRRVASMRPLKARITMGADGARAVFVQAKSRVGKLWLELDSGNAGAVLLAPHAIGQLGMQLPESGKRAVELDIPGLGRVPVVAMRKSIIYDGVLDLAMMEHFVWTIDLKDNRVWARPIKGGQVVHKAISLPAADLERFVGTYRMTIPGMTLTITRTGDQLNAQLPGQSPYPIYPETNSRFFYKVVPAELFFRIDASRKKGDGGN